MRGDVVKRWPAHGGKVAATSIEMQIDNPIALAQFKLGGDYYVDFTPVEIGAAKVA